MTRAQLEHLVATAVRQGLVRQDVLLERLPSMPLESSLHSTLQALVEEAFRH